MKEFFDMSGYGPFIWSAYAIAIGGLALNVWMARRQLRDAQMHAKRRLALQEENT